MEWLHYLEWIWFVLVPLLFIGIVAWVFRPSARKRYREAKNLPFEERTPHERGRR